MKTSGNHINSECFPVPPRMSNEKRFKSLEEKGQSALEMAKEEDEAPKASPENAKQVV